MIGAEAGSFGRCGDKRFGDNLPGECSGVLEGSISGGRLAHGEPREPLRSFKPIGGGGDAGVSSSAAATTTTGSVRSDKGLISPESDATDLLK